MKCFGNLNHSLAELCVHNTKSFLALNIFFIFCILKTFLCFLQNIKDQTLSLSGYLTVVSSHWDTVCCQYIHKIIWSNYYN